MMFIALFLASLLVSVFAQDAPAANQTQHNITVGGNGQLYFNPAQVSINAGDILAFTFVQGNHSVTQSSFAEPCTPVEGGVDSGFRPIAVNGTARTFRFQVNNVSVPYWFFCAQLGHCEQGMVFAVNPTQEKSFDAFKSAAIGVNYTLPAAPPNSAHGLGGKAGFGTTLAVLAALLAVLML